jgi:hypothetical protein
MLDDVLKVSPHGSFKVTQLCVSVAICEAIKGDRYGWGNGSETEPAFIVYLGCKKDEVKGYIRTPAQSRWVEPKELILNNLDLSQ